MVETDQKDRLLRQAVRYGGGWTATLALVALVGAVAELLLPAVLGLAVDATLAGSSPRWPAAACGLIAIIITTETVGDLAAGYGAAQATARLRQHLLRHLFALDVRTTRRYPVGDLVGRLVGQAADVGQAGRAVVLGLIALLPPLGSVLALLMLEPVLGVTLLTGLAFLALFMRAFVTDASAATAGYQRIQGLIAGRLVESLTGARTIAAAATTDREIVRVLEPLPGLRAHGLRNWHLLAGAATRTTAMASMLQLAVVAVGGYALTAGWLTPGELVTAMRYAALGAGLGVVLATLNRLVRCRAGSGRVAELLAEPSLLDGDESLPAGPGALRLRQVTVLGTDGRTILQDIDLDVPGGRTVAVVGASGAGKSALAAVAGRLHDPDAGEVTLDGVPLRRLSRRALRQAVGYAFERPILIGYTVHDAVALGMPDESAAPDELAPSADAPPPPDAPLLAGARPATPPVHLAARLAAVDGCLSRLPDGYRTPLADAPLSGGEDQRLGLARALHAERVLILDDATSSVDTATEHRITQAIADRTGGRTRLVVTHRATTAAAADLVAWLDGGRLRALAPHRVLWTDQAYRDIFLVDAA